MPRGPRVDRDGRQGVSRRAPTLLRSRSLPPEFRPRRSLLFMPGSNPRALGKARTLPADGLIFDLEDAVAPAAKEAARASGCRGARCRRLRPPRAGGAGQAARHAVGRDRHRRRGRDADRRGAAAEGREPGQVRRASALLDAAGAPADRALWCMLETPLGILEAPRDRGGGPAACSTGRRHLRFDQGSARPAHPRPPPLVPALGLIVLAARAHGLAALDGVHLDLADAEGFAFCLPSGPRARLRRQDLDPPEPDRARQPRLCAERRGGRVGRRVIAAHAAAAAAGNGVVLLDGRLVENLHVEDARPACSDRRGDPPARDGELVAGAVMKCRIARASVDTSRHAV